MRARGRHIEVSDAVVGIRFGVVNDHRTVRGDGLVAFRLEVNTVSQQARFIEQAKGRLHLKARRTILFIDEIHRFNKAQQDAFLPHVENGTIVLIGATTQNPSFSVIPALLSRCRVLTLGALSPESPLAWR